MENTPRRSERLRGNQASVGGVGEILSRKSKPSNSPANSVNLQREVTSSTTGTPTDSAQKRRQSLSFVTPDSNLIPTSSERTMTHRAVNETADISVLPKVDGKSTWIAQQLLDSLESLRSTYRWDDEKTSRMLGSRLKG